MLRFACSNCGQRLKVGSQKAGKTAVCPKCKQTVTVPQAAPEPESPEIEAEPEGPPVSGTKSPAEETSPFNFNPGIEVVYEVGGAQSSRQAKNRTDDAARIDYDRVSLPRYVIYTQGVLLAATGIMCFLLGIAVGGAVSEMGSNRPTAKTPITVSGTVAFAKGGNRSPDDGAVVVFLPQDARPDEKASLEGVRPGNDPAEGAKTRDFVSVLGGGVTRCDQKGQYSIQLPDRGRYYLLAISANARPLGDKHPPAHQLIEMGRFFDVSAGLLEKNRIVWRQEGLRGSQRVNVNFD